MLLKKLLKHKNIVIQCHDYPDADAIASGFVLLHYLTGNHINCKFIYSGEQEIRRESLNKMISLLNIPINYVREIEKPELLITVDCQYGEGNVTHFDAENVAIIDHHEICVPVNDMTCIRSELSSCSTLIYMLLNQVGFNADSDRRLATALYYGLCMDTREFSDAITTEDMQMLRNLDVDYRIINAIKDVSLSNDEMEMADRMNIDRYTCDDVNYAIVRTTSGDPNVLGMINDTVLEQNNLNLCIVYNELDSAYKLSVRCPEKQDSAHDVAAYITGDMGNGGGHKTKAGGTILKNEFQCESGKSIDEFLKTRIEEYIHTKRRENPTS